MVLRNVAKQFSFEQQRQEINEIAVDLDAINTTLTNYNASNWDTAYGWGNHASAGYWVQNTTKISNWDTAYGWGNHASAGYLTSQTSHADVVVDGDFTSTGLMKRGATAGSYSVITDNSTNWDSAYGWGNHASAGYLTSIGSIDSHSDVTISSISGNQLLRYNSTTSQWENWTPNYLTTVPTQSKIQVLDTSVTAVDPGTGGYIITLIDGVEKQRVDGTWMYMGHTSTGITWPSIEGSTTSVYANISRVGATGSLSFDADPSNSFNGSEFTFNIDSTERLKISNTGDTTISNGNLIIGTSGKGIDFSANANAAGMSSELLDDYEEGTWTPTISSGGTAVVVDAGNCIYAKVGDVVVCHFEITSITNPDASTLILGGLPFTASNEGSFPIMTNVVTFPAGTTMLSGYYGVSQWRIYGSGSGTGWTAVTGSQVGNGDIIGTITYRSS